MKLIYSSLISCFLAVAIAAPIAHPAPDAIASPEAAAEADAWRWHSWVKNQAIYKREADADANPEAEAEAEADAWRWHSWVRNQAIYKREDPQDFTYEESEPNEEPLGFIYAFESRDSSEPSAYHPIFFKDIEDEIYEHFNLSSSKLPSKIIKGALFKREAEAGADANPEAEAEADAWRWHSWVRNQAIYKREADAEAEADANANADADASAWRWHSWVRNQAIY